MAGPSRLIRGVLMMVPYTVLEILGHSISGAASAFFDAIPEYEQRRGPRSSRTTARNARSSNRSALTTLPEVHLQAWT